jgi:hypothetical protein
MSNKTLKQINAELAETSAQIEALAEALQTAKQKVRALQSAQSEAAKREQRNWVNRNRAKAKRLALKYDIEIEDDSVRDYDGYDLRHWVGQPEWLEGDDPLEDGHFSHCWSETVWLVEFYAKHHPSHPEHASREFASSSPHC